MGKLTTFVLLYSGLLLLFYFSGLIQDTGNSALLNLLLSPESMATGNFKIQTFLILEGIAAAATIVVGIVTGNLELALIGPYAIYLFNLFWDFLYIFNVLKETNPVLALLLFSPLCIVYMITIVEWWRGRD